MPNINWPDVTVTSLLTLTLITIWSFLLRPYLDAYLKKKGENLATKEDLDAINSKVEQIKQVFIEKNAYLTEKGKNAATREDISLLTTKVEAIRGHYASSIEYLKTDLSKEATIHRLAAEKEIQALTEIGEALINLKISSRKVSPFNLVDNPNDGKFIIRKEQVSIWAKTVDEFYLCVEKNYLFLPTSIYDELFEIYMFCGKQLLSSGKFLNMNDDLSPTDKILRSKEFFMGLENVVNNAISKVRERYKLNTQ